MSPGEGRINPGWENLSNGDTELDNMIKDKERNVDAPRLSSSYEGPRISG